MLIDGVADLVGPLRCAGCRRLGTMLCPACLRGLERPPADPPIDAVDAAVVPWAYTGAARALVLALKLRAQRAAAEPLVDGVCAEVPRRGLVGSVMTWVPARRADVKARGFDHAQLLAMGVSRRLGIPARPLLRRALSSRDQASLGAGERRANLQGVFVASGFVSGGVVLVDDLVTTGATAAACAGALRDSGAREVELLAPCRA